MLAVEKMGTCSIVFVAGLPCGEKKKMKRPEAAYILDVCILCKPDGQWSSDPRE